MAGIALLINPMSRRNRRDPTGVHRLAMAMGDTGQVHSPDKDGLPVLATALAHAPPTVVAIHGGDGTVHHILSVLIPAFAAAGRALPPLALLPGGTMNVVARSLGLLADPRDFLAGLADLIRDGAPLPSLERHCLQVGDQFGFVFGNGMFAAFLEQYYAVGSYGPGRALWVGLRAVGSGLYGGAYARKALRPYRGAVIVDGERLNKDEHTAVTASTVSQVGLGFKLNHRADEDIERFSVVAVTCGPLELLADLPAVRVGQGIDPDRADTRTARELVLAPEEPMVYTIDGDLYRTSNPLRVGLGPQLSLLKPPPGRG